MITDDKEGAQCNAFISNRNSTLHPSISKCETRLTSHGSTNA